MVRQSPEEIERDIGRTRAEIDQVLNALQARLSPGAIFDQLFRSVRGRGDVAVNMARAMRDNPVPVALIAVGVAWLAVANGRQGSRPRAIASRRSPASGADAPSAVSTVSVDTRERPAASWADEKDAREEQGARDRTATAEAAAAQLREKRRDADPAAARAGERGPAPGQPDDKAPHHLRMGNDHKAESIARVAQSTAKPSTTEAAQATKPDAPAATRVTVEPVAPTPIRPASASLTSDGTPPPADEDAARHRTGGGKG